MQPSRQESSKRVVPEVLFPNFSHKKCAKYSLLVFLDSSNFVGKFCVSWVPPIFLVSVFYSKSLHGVGAVNFFSFRNSVENFASRGRFRSLST